MKKIEPAAWIERHELLQIDDSFEMATYLNKSETYQDSVPLWTDDALQAVAEAVAKACSNEMWRAHGLAENFEAIDLAAIINQLKGK